MKRRKIMAYLILFSMIFSVLGGSINSQAKKNRISLNYKKTYPANRAEEKVKSERYFQKSKMVFL